MYIKYETPQKMTIRDILEMIDTNKKPVQRFEYGEEGNWYTAVIQSIGISLNFTHLGKPKRGDREYLKISLAIEYIGIFDIEQKGYINARRMSKYGYEDFYFDKEPTLQDIYNTELEIDGYWEE